MPRYSTTLFHLSYVDHDHGQNIVEEHFQGNWGVHITHLGQVSDETFLLWIWFHAITRVGFPISLMWSLMIVLNVSFVWSANFRICEHLSTMTMFHKQPSSWVFCVFFPFLSLVTWLPCRCYCPFIHSLIEIILLLLQLPISKKKEKKKLMKQRIKF